MKFKTIAKPLLYLVTVFYKEDTKSKKRIIRILWSQVSNESFKALKDALTSIPILVLPDFSLTFILELDILFSGLGAVLP